MQEFSTPMMKQYQAIKREYADCLLFFRLGDFYELFLEDAHIGAQVLNITLTSRPKGRDGRIAMAGVPYHAVDSYLAKLVKAGYKVAICEQMSEPDKKGIVERQVVRVVTPGTLLDERALSQKEHNFLIAIALTDTGFALSACDISTGHFEVLSDQTLEWRQVLSRELTRINPVECILSDREYHNISLMKLLANFQGLNVFPFINWESDPEQSARIIKQQFLVDTLIPFQIEEDSVESIASGNLIKYLKHTQKDKLSHIKTLQRQGDHAHMTLDRATIVNLELFSTLREHETRGALLTVIDKTQTAMGGRQLKEIMKLPLTNRELIVERHEAVKEFITHSGLRRNILRELKETNDIERILSRLATGLGNARDMKTLEIALTHILTTKHILVSVQSKLLTELQRQISPQLHEVTKLISNTFVEDPPVATSEGKMIRLGVDSGRDALANIAAQGKEWLVELEAQERARSGIGSLKVRFNKVFGFYIEVSKANVQLVPKNYIRKQTLVNGERYTTIELTAREEEILNAEVELKKLEFQIFNKTLEKVLSFIEVVQDAARSVALLDCLLSFSEVAIEQNYCKPTMIYSGEIRIKEGRHAVVETLLPKHTFVPNSCDLSNIHTPLLLVTGPNMAGKSVFIRQIALIVFLAHIGSFVPAQSARISLVDNIFVRSGASDVITSGLSTFMVEMVETAYILRNASEKSLIIMDEIGRGTSTYDGISIAWAVAEYLVTHEKIVPKTLFATHYHELQKLEEAFPRKIKNMHMGVSIKNKEPVMLYSLESGPAEHSFGVAVAKRAGVPKEVIERATTLLRQFENEKTHEVPSVLPKQEIPVTDTLSKINIDTTTPLEALHILSTLKKKFT